MRNRSARTPGPAAVLAIAAALFAIVLVLKLTVRAPGFGFPLLYDIPVALLAIALGLRAGLTGAAVGMVLYAIGDAVGEIHSNVWGYTSRALTFVLLGGLLGLYSDRLRRAEATTRDSEAHFRAALEHSPVVVWQQDRDLHYTWIHNPPLSLADDDILGKTDAELMAPDAASRLTAVKQEVLQTGQGRRIEVEYRGGEAPAWFDVTLNPLRGPDGEVAGLTAAATDITSLKLTQEANRRLAAIFDQSEDAIVAKDTDGVITEWNHGAERLYDYSAEEAIGESISIVFPRETAAEDRRVLSRVLEGDVLEGYETVRRRKDGGRVDVWLTISPIRDAQGTIVGASSIARDISELKWIQRNLERSNAELEEFADVASHDLQEPLRSIAGFAQLLERRYKGQLDSEGDRFIDLIVTGVERLQTLIDDLLSYSRAGRDELQRVPVDSRQLVERTLTSLDAVVRDAGAKVDRAVAAGNVAPNRARMVRNRLPHWAEHFVRSTPAMLAGVPRRA
jgi:PAS domain S-box-containing protein